jgi:hypothetical protein
MSSKNISKLAIIAIIMVTAAVIVHLVSNRPAQTNQIRTYLIQGLDPDKVATIVISENDKSTHLQRQGKIFVVSEKNDYPATTERINELFTEVLDIQTKELITDKPQNHPDLEVTPDKAQSIVEFLGSDTNAITGVVLGKRTDNGDAYIRLMDSDNVYLCENAPFVRTGPMDYIDQKLLSVNRDDIISVTVTGANGVTYTLESELNSTNVTLAGALPQGKKLSPHSTSVFTAPTSIRFDNVFKAGSEPGNPTFNHTFICRLNNSTQYILKLAKAGDKNYAVCSAVFTGAEEQTPDKNVSDEQMKKQQAQLEARDAVAKFNAKCTGWVYELPKWKTDNLTKPLEDILEDIKPEKEKTEDTKPAPDAGSQ